MSFSQASRTVIVANPEGLHARAAVQIRELVQRFRARVELIKGSQRVDATEVLQVLSLCALPGDELVLEARGEQAAAVLEELADLFARRFDADEPPKQQET